MKPRHIPMALFLIAAFMGSAQAGENLGSAVEAEHRTEAFRARDKYRHPLPVLEFYGLMPDMAVVEIWPGRGWWTEILAPYLAGSGNYYAAGFSLTAERTPDWRRTMQRGINEHWAANPDLYGKMIVTGLSVPEDTEIAPAGSADLVLTFRNVHNWMKGEYAPGVFEAMHAALKPGGILGVVEHRADPGTSLEEMITSGYVTEDQVRSLAAHAGFVFVASSEVNANPNDSKDHPAGVWTLPPSLRMKDQDRDKYLAIGESDRMTLKFRKPGGSEQ